MTTNWHGLVVGGDIGPQGSTTAGNGNQWLPISASWTGGLATHTYTINNYDPLPGSKLYVVNSGTYNPINNGNDGSAIPYALLSGSIIYAAGNISPGCASPPSYSGYYLMTGPQSSNNSYFRAARWSE
jgi:hypothetical protein